MRRSFWFVLVPCLALGGLIAAAIYAYENRLYASVSHLVSDETKQTLKNTVFVFQTKDELEREVAALEKRIDQFEDVQDLLDVAMRNNPNLAEYLPFAFVAEQQLEAGQDRFLVTSYETPFIPLDYFGRRAYLETHGGDLLLVSAKGTVGRMALDKVTGDSFDMKAVTTNLSELIVNPDFYEIGEISIKDALVVGEELLLSYSKELSENCYTLAIAASGLNAEVLEFEDIFVPDECIPEDNDYGEFSGNQSGGRMLATGPGTLLFSTGEMRYRDLAQDPDSFFGKVVEIDLAAGSYVVKSMGHRNPQGLYYDAEANVIVISEHGPEGGDEININRTPDGPPENFGWPVSSYGEHYSTKQEVYDKAPLHKSHTDYGFLEPELHFEPSLSPTQILKLEDPRDPDRYSLLLGTMGFDYREGDESLHIFDLDEDFRIVSRDRIVLDDRIRDMIHIPDAELYALFLEGDSFEFGTIALVKVNP